jgi:hypothetical protein
MTTPSPDDATVRRSDLIKTRASSTRPAAEQDWSGWENWMEGHKTQVLDAACEAAGEVIGVTAAGLEKRIKALELQLAETRGALDVLRDGALDVLRDKGASSTDNVNETIDKIRTDFQEKVKEIELRLAETIGTVDVLRGKGVPGALHVRGTFDSSATYCLNDLVAHNGGSWVAKKDNPGPIPSENWQLVASQGKRGVQGERGPAGPAGIPPTFMGATVGRRGMEIETSAGPIPLVKSVAVDAQNFTLKLIAADDSALTISLLPMFQEFRRQTQA